VANNLSWGSSGLGSTTKQLEACFSSNNVSTVLNRVKSVIFSYFLIFSQPAVNHVGKVWQSLATAQCQVSWGPCLCGAPWLRFPGKAGAAMWVENCIDLHGFASLSVRLQILKSINSASIQLFMYFGLYQSAVSISCDAVQTDYARWSQGPAKDVFPVKGTQGTEGRAHAVWTSTNHRIIEWEFFGIS